MGTSTFSASSRSDQINVNTKTNLFHVHFLGESDDGSGVDGVHGLMAHERPLLQSSSFQRGLQQEGDEGVFIAT